MDVKLKQPGAAEMKGSGGPACGDTGSSSSLSFLIDVLNVASPSPNPQLWLLEVRCHLRL